MEANEPPPAQEASPAQPVKKRHQRHLLACVGCRKIKTRCLGNEDQVSACQRCRRLNLECVYARKRRRKFGSHPPPPHVPASVVSVASTTGDPPTGPSNILSADYSGPGSNARPDVLSESSVRFQSRSPSATLAGPSASKRLDIREYLDPVLPRDVNVDVHQAIQGAQGELGGGLADDPITLQLLTVHEADTLLGLYMQHINPITATLDGKFHTLGRIRTTSPILLSAILSVAAKFFRRQLYRHLLAHTHTIVNRAVGLGVCDIGLVQALIIMICWKDPNDGSSWVKLGIAIRLGYQLGLHIPRAKPLPVNEFEARTIANSERTWFTLSSFDRLYSDVFSLPPTIRLEETPDAVRWAEETEWLGCGDMRHACSFSSASTYRIWVKYRRNFTSMSRDLACAILTDLYVQIDEHMKRWFPPDPSSGKITAFEQMYLKWFDLNHLLKIKYHMLDICLPNERESELLDWLQLAEMFTKQSEALGLVGTLRYLQDTSATHVSSFGVMVYNIFSRLGPIQKRIATDYVKRLAKCCDVATLGDGDTVMSFVGRFMNRLRHVLATSEHPPPGHDLVGAAHPHDLPLPPDDTTHGANLDLDDFFRAILQNGQTAEAAATDHQFWFDPNVSILSG